MNSVAVIIITFNSSSCVNKCLESVRKNFSDKLKVFFVLIDNNSSDSSATIIQKQQDQNTIVHLNSKNIGFAKAVNQGIKLAKNRFSPHYYLLLNPDAALGDKTIERLVMFAEKNNSTIPSPIIHNASGKGYWFCGAKIDWLKQKTVHFLEPTNINKPYQTDILSGCCMLIPEEAINELDLFDEKFYLYYEDADYSLRARNKGFLPFVIPSAECYHKESQSSTTEVKCYNLVKSGLHFFQKHMPFWLKPYFWLNLWSRFFYHNLISRKKCVIRGINDYLNEKNLPKTDNSI